MKILSKRIVENYKWGNNCDGWKFIDRKDLAIILEKIPVNCSEKAHFHKNATQFFIIQTGKAKIIANHKEYILNPQEGLEIESFTLHSVQNYGDTDLEFILISSPKAHGDRIDVSYRLRNATLEDISQLTELAFLSKAYWGYPKEWLDLWQNDLIISEEFLKNSVSVLAELNGKIIGFWCREAIQTDRITNGSLFIHPEFMGQGLAKNLWRALSVELKEKGINSFLLEADPNAIPFYLSIGAVQVGEVYSKIIKERKIPILHLYLE
ncbi:GNAT family N-acetyltransferase [Fluviispira vulneris]|uniref:GNAT family N-acetyltransferase n=1 Tax=Fluviispira vulneris TaxID=2763012 RepID=UPI001648E847|nr:GNAT family N-acetyltransferase [Fluviispira vulneris]